MRLFVSKCIHESESLFLQQFSVKIYLPKNQFVMLVAQKRFSRKYGKNA